jgi:Animal haem peroxidase
MIMKRHMRDNYYIVGEGTVYCDHDGKPAVEPYPGDIPEMRKFRFSRIGPKGTPVKRATVEALATAMTATGGDDSAGPTIPAGFTYLGQFIDHDLTLDKTAVALGQNVTLDELLQGRSPALDLDSIYGRGPSNAEDSKFYSDGIRIKMGKTAPSPDLINPGVTLPPRDGYDLPRVGEGSTKLARRRSLIPYPRNDENLIVAQTHLAMIRFHNRVVDLIAPSTPSTDLFEKARELVVKHYQWMIKTDFLPRLIDPAVVNDVFSTGRKFFEKDAPPANMPTMPIEFSVAAYRLGHSMIRGAYNWNRIFKAGGAAPATLGLLFQFSGTSGTLSPPPSTPNDRESGDFERLPSNWTVDFRRLYDFTEAGRNDLTPPEGVPNITKKIDTQLVDPLKSLPHGSFGGSDATPDIEMNLAFRNLMRANMVQLASGQQMAALMGISPLSSGKLSEGLPVSLKEAVSNTPLWYYILREAELNGGKLTGVGGRIVAETFHRAMEGSVHSIVRDPSFRPTALVANPGDRFNMVDLLLFAFEGRADLLAPLGD